MILSTAQEIDEDHIYVYTDHNPDTIRVFYEIPDAVARLIQASTERRTFVQCLADLVDVTKTAL